MKKLFLIFTLACFTFAACDNAKDTETTAAKVQVQKKKPGQGGGNPNNPPAPLPCGRITPDPALTNVTVTTYSNTMSLTFDPIAPLAPGDSVGYALYYLVVPQPTAPSGGIVQLDGLWYKQASANYYHLPMWIPWGWSTMWYNVIYTCRMGVYSSSGCYQYSQSFTVDTSL